MSTAVGNPSNWSKHLGGQAIPARAVVFNDFKESML